MAYNNAILNNVYNYYMTTYSPKTSTRYDTHKKSELRSIYNSIVKLNKDAPLYKMDTSKASKSFAVGIKEDARELRNVIASLGGLDEEKILNKKASFSSNEDIVSVNYIGNNPDNSEIPTYEIEVYSLASGQVNMGTFLPNTKPALPPDTYSFDVLVNDLNYEFQYNIREGETNRDIHERLTKLVNSAEIGLHADVIEDGKGNTSIRLRSVSEGMKNNDTPLFIISDEHTSKQPGSVAYFGLDYLARPASNAEFSLNGERMASASNRFTIDKMFDVTLKGISSMEGSKTTFGLKTDVESLAENISTLTGGYNSFINSMAAYRDNFSGSQKLLREMNGIINRYRSELDVIGLNLQENGTLEIDTNELKQAALSQYAKEDFSSVRNFANSLVRKMNQISINPMDYVDKTIVAYKNPGKNFPSPYITSAYSGMLFNFYC